MDTELVLDGNALAGVFQELFQHELTTALGTCGACGRIGPLAETSVYVHAPGAVVRCRACEAVLFTITKEGGRYWLGFDRLRCVEIREWA
jgi:hypothetical protein